MPRPVDKPSESKDISKLQQDMYDQKRKRAAPPRDQFVREVTFIRSISEDIGET